MAAGGRIDDFLADGAEYPVSSRRRRGVRIHHGCPGWEKLTSRRDIESVFFRWDVRARIAGRPR
jgi:hypothetical protein